MYRKFFKRLIDILVCLIALPFFLLIFIVVAPIIKLSDGGPVFYNAPRLGYKGKIYKMYKFRSMRVNAPDIRNADGTTYNGKNDPRVTKIGRILRETSLDETPQILNVLKGDMSIIGPRAFLPTNFPGYENLPPRTQRRLDALPGITGYCQAYYRNNATLKEKVEYDAYYVDNLSFKMDIKVLFKTVASVIKRDNIYVSASEETEKKAKEAVESGEK